MAQSIFAFELCLRFDPQLAGGLSGMLSADTTRPSPGHLWHLWSTAARELAARRRGWVSGCWDFWDDDTKAKTLYPDWVGSLMRAEGARTAPSGAPDPYRGAERYMTVTLACLLVRSAASTRALAGVCAIPEAYLWHGASFERILAGIPHINFAAVERATTYVIPKDDGWALTADDLKDPKFKYLRPIL